MKNHLSLLRIRKTMNGSELLSQAPFALLPFLGFETCNALGNSCKQASEIIDSYPHLSLIEGKSKQVHVEKTRRSRFFHCLDFEFCIEDFLVLKDGRLILYDGRACYIVDKNKEILPLRGKCVKEYAIPLGIQGISLRHDILFFAHGYTLKCFKICDFGHAVKYIGNSPILLHDEQDLDWLTQTQGCSNQEYYLYDHVLYSAHTNLHIVKTLDAKIFCSISKGFILCGKNIQIFNAEDNTSKFLTIDVSGARQIQATKCGSVIYVLLEDCLLCIARGKCRSVNIRAKSIYLQTHLYYITIDNKLFILH